ncbi:hypothetical protein ACLB2K_005508 [Fragaria x ananassa]
MVNAYNVEHKGFMFGERLRIISVDDVSNIFGLPKEGVMLNATTHITKPEGNFIINTYFKGDKVTKVMIDDSLRAAIRDKKQQKPRDVVCLMTMSIFATFIFCGSGSTLSWKLVETCTDDMTLKNYNWAQIILDYHHQGLIKKKEDKDMALSGCLPLMLDMIEAHEVDRKPDVVELQSLKDGEIHMEELETPSFGEWMNANYEEMRNEGERAQERMRELIGSLEETTAQSNSTQEECNKAQELLQKLKAENEKLKEKNEANNKTQLLYPRKAYLKSNDPWADRALMMATTCFRDTSSNTFNFRFDQMGITLLDLYVITDLPVSNKPYQEINFEEEVVAFEADPNRHNFCKSYESWVDHYIAESGEASGIAFLELWLTKFIVYTSTQKITDAWVHATTLLFNGHKLGLAQMTLAILYRALNPQITDFPDNQVLGIPFTGAKAYDPLSYSDCFQHLYTLDASALDSNELMLNRMYPEALANKFMSGTTHSLEALHLFEQAISIADLRLPDDAGFELYAPNHFARQLGFQQEIPLPLFESVNMYTSWRLRKKGKKQIDDPRFQSKFTRLKVKIRSISLIFASKEINQTYNAWWSMIFGDLWTMDPLYLFRIIFANGQTLLPLQDQTLFSECTSASYVPKMAPAANQEPIQDDEPASSQTSDTDATAETTSERVETNPANGGVPNTICSSPLAVSSPQTSMEAALMDALEMPSLAPEMAAAKDLLEIKHLEELEFRLVQIPGLQDNLQ